MRRAHAVDAIERVDRVGTARKVRAHSPVEDGAWTPLMAHPTVPHFNDALFATSAHFAISLLRKASSFAGDPPT